MRTELKDFQLINPCGITDRGVTSLEREAARPETLPDLETIAHEAARQFGLVYGEQVLAVETVDALRRQAALRPARAEDTPLTIPREVERLHGDAERPVRA